MKTATRAYKSQMARQLRNRSRVAVSFGNVDVTAGTDGNWDGDFSYISRLDTIDYAHIYPTTEATLELNRWVLDGSNSVRDANGNYGLIGNDMSDANGDIDFSITRDFASFHALSGLSITFDSNMREYPLEATLTFNNEDSTSVNAEIQPEDTVVEVGLNSDNVIQVVLSISKMMPYRRPRILTTIWGVGHTYGNAELISTKQSTDVDPLARRLPSEKFSFTIHDYQHTFDPDNPKGVYATINKGAPIAVSYGYELDDGTVEWLQSDTYALDNKPVFANSKVTFTGSGLLSTMTGTYYKGTLGAQSFYDLALSVLEDADLTPLPSGDMPWDIDDSLKDMYTNAPMPIQSHATCLQMIAHACNCRLYTDDQNIIHISPFGVTPAGLFSGRFSDNGHAWISSWDSVDYGSNSNSTYATLEWNRWILGTNQTIANADNLTAKGYVSANMSEADLSLDNTVWQKRFDVIHDIPNLVLTFDDCLDEYPRELTVDYYDRTNTLIGSKTVNPTDYKVEITSDYEDCEYFVVTMSEMAIPYRRARITKAAYFETDFALTLGSAMQNTMVTTMLDKIRNVDVNMYQYFLNGGMNNIVGSAIVGIATLSEDDKMDKLYEGITDEETLHVEYNAASAISVEVSGGSLLSSEVYAQAADLVMTPGTKTIVINGISISESSTVYRYNFNTSGEDDIEENKLITNKTMADAHAAHIGQYLGLRNTYDANYRGNPEVESGDIISLETAYKNVVYGLVLVDEISFGGTLSGKLKVKGLI